MVDTRSIREAPVCLRFNLYDQREWIKSAPLALGRWRLINLALGQRCVTGYIGEGLHRRVWLVTGIHAALQEELAL